MSGKLTEIKDWLEIEIQRALFGVRTLWLDFRTADIKQLLPIFITLLVATMIPLSILMIITAFGS